MIDQSQTAQALGRLRTLSGYSQRAAARQLGVRGTVLRSWEEGSVLPTATQMDALLSLYGRDVKELLKPRQPLVSADQPGVLRIGSRSVDTVSIRVDASNASEANRRIVAQYLAAVRSERGSAPGDLVELRAVDMRQLADVLDLSDQNLEELLATQLDLTPAGAQFAVRAVLVAGLMTAALLGGIGSRWLRTVGEADALGSGVRPNEASLVIEATPLDKSAPLEILPAYVIETTTAPFSTNSSARSDQTRDLFSVVPRTASSEAPPFGSTFAISPTSDGHVVSDTN